MSYGVFNNESSIEAVGNFSSPCGPSLRTRTDSRDGQSGEDLAATTGCEKAP